MFYDTYSYLIVSMSLGALLGLSLYLPLMTGQLSLASPGFYALGGYIAAIWSTQVIPTATGLYPLGWVFLELLLAGLVAGVLGVAMGVPILRLRGIYLAIATIAFVEVLRIIALSLEITGGAVGIFGIPQPVQTPLEYLWFTGPLLVLTVLFLYRLERIRPGRAMIAIRADELAASTIGINPTFYKVLAFTLGAIIAGMTGVIAAHFLNTWNARQGTFDAGVIYLTAVLIGGNRTFIGPVVGGIVFTALPEVLRGLAGMSGLPSWLAQFLQDGRLVIFGILMVCGTIWFPRGLVVPEMGAKIKRFGHQAWGKLTHRAG